MSFSKILRVLIQPCQPGLRRTARVPTALLLCVPMRPGKVGVRVMNYSIEIHMSAYILMMYVTYIYTLRTRNKQLNRHSLDGSRGVSNLKGMYKQPDVGRGRLQPRVCGKILDVTAGPRPKKSQPRKVWVGGFTVGRAKKCATLLAWGVIFLLACFQIFPLG